MYAYSFANIVVTINGTPISGFGAGDDVITIEPSTAAATTQVGADGHMVASISANQGGTATLHLQQTSPSNYTLQELYNLQISQSAQFQPIQMSVQDAMGNDACTCIGGIITDMATWQRGANAVDTEWTVQFEVVRITRGTQNELSFMAAAGFAMPGIPVPGLGL